MPKNDIINGGYLVIKPKGVTSRGVDNIIGKLLGTRRVGHVGTLDPSATGLLPVLIGKATKVACFIDSGVKGYSVEIVLGVTTDTDDSTGEVIDEKPIEVDEKTIRNVIEGFIGEIEQVPPRYSAKKYYGVPLYKLARKGVEIKLEPRKVKIFSIEDIDIKLPRVRFNVVCSTGTYMRALARDIGFKLGCGAHLSWLERTRVGPHRIEDGIPLEEIVKSIREGEPQKYLLSVNDLLPHLKRVSADPMEAWKVKHGQIIPHLAYDVASGEIFAIEDSDGEIIAIAEKTDEGYKYKRVLT